MTWWWLLEGTHLVLRSSSTAFQPMQQTICLLTFCFSAYAADNLFADFLLPWYILLRSLFWVSVSRLCTLPGIHQPFLKWFFEPLVQNIMLDDNVGICFSIECGVLSWNLFTHSSAALDNCVWFSTLNLWCPKFMCFSNFLHSAASSCFFGYTVFLKLRIG